VFEAVQSPYLAPFDATFEPGGVPTAPPADARRSESRQRLAALTEELSELQPLLYAHDHHALLLIFQAMDAAGKDGTIRAVMQGVNPAGCQVFSFKQPSREELDHDFLWRTARRLPERGRIGIFNRSYYEEVLVVRVHPELLAAQRLPDRPPLDALWPQRYASIRDHEAHLARNGMVILKFWLNVSKAEQKRRFLSRIDEPHKNWKFSAGDVRERGRWDAYMAAYRDAIAATSRPWAPWYAVPADDKPYMRMVVADIVVRSLKALGLRYPEVREEDRRRFAELRRMLEAEAGG
jgi:PPK2 family polyphosphate:nucleotide phosphotransferase